MTSEQREAHLRMICSLPVRKVDAKEHVETMLKRRQRVEVRIKGQIFPSITEAAKRLKISTKTVYTMAKYGAAQFLSPGTQTDS